MKENALFIGRFQPLHNGHLATIAEIAGASDVKSLTIGIGSSNRSFLPENPFTANERQSMIQNSLKIAIPYQIKDIPDLNDNQQWIETVLQQNPDTKIVYTGNRLVSELFEKAGLQVRTPRFIAGVCATEIRKMIIRGQDWHYFVPEGTLTTIKNIGGVQRLREIYCRYLRPGVTVDMLVDYKEQGLLFIKRLKPPFQDHWAFPGGFVEYGIEDTREAAARELKEETSLVVKPENFQLLNVYSSPGRDPRGHVISIAYFTEAFEGEMRAADDAKEVKIFPINQPPKNLAFDHFQIWSEYQNRYSKFNE